MEAKNDKCCICKKQAVAYFPVCDPDIPAYPYCADHLEKAMVDMANALWKDDKGMQAIAISHARESVKKYRKE